MTTIVEHARIDTPIGPLAFGVIEGALRALSFEDDVRAALERRLGAVALEESADPAGVRTRLSRYFDGELGALDAIRVELGGTPFQRLVWAALRAIPVGETLSYGELARRIGRPAAVRAVGLANKKNPVAIVVPCHRVIAGDGSLHGYGGGLDRKRWLLDHETGARQGVLVGLARATPAVAAAQSPRARSSATSAS